MKRGCATVIALILVIGIIGIIIENIGKILVLGAIGYGIYLLVNRKNFSSFSKKRKIISIVSIVLMLAIGSSLASSGTNNTNNNVARNDSINTADANTTTETDKLISTEETQEIKESEENTTNTPVEGKLEVHFIDVGQADSILIKTPTGESMLIDAGNNEDASLVTTYLRNQGLNKIDVVVGTHPHEDHIGGLDAVINSFNIGKVYMPKVSHTTKTYEDVLLAIQNKGLKITAPTPGSTFNLGQAKFTILAPNSSSYEDLNNYSIVIKMEYGNNSFLFTGDAEDISENEMISKGFDLSADVLKVGHHGSSSSTTQTFLNKVNPKYAVIMVGKDNSYGHPHEETMNKLKSKGITVYRTDENGTVIAISDGTNITFNTNPGSYTSRGNGSTSSSGTTSSNSSSKTTTSNSNKTSSGSSTTVVTPSTSNTNTANRTVYWTPKGKSYHYSKDCSTLSRSKTILSGPLSQCPKSDPCDRCTY